MAIIGFYIEFYREVSVRCPERVHGASHIHDEDFSVVK